jgi:hypothetical protein
LTQESISNSGYNIPEALLLCYKYWIPWDKHIISAILFAIDALNEGYGTKIWKNYLAGLESEIERFPWIALVVSVRTDCLKILSLKIAGG